MAISMATRLAMGLFSLVTLLGIVAPVCSIGVNYGTVGDNLPPPSEVARFLKENTIIDRIKIFDLDREILKAFADTGILVTVTVPNGDIPSLTDPGTAAKWVKDNVKPFYPATKIHYIAVGNEILHWGSPEIIDSLVPAMRTLHEALAKAGMRDVKVSTPHSLGILLSSDPPSTGAFRPGWDVGIMKPMLEFLNETGSGFMVNPYPYFGYSPGNDSFALFRPNPGIVDVGTGKKYTNMFDVLLDSVYVAMKKLGFPDVEIVVAETGWPSRGEPWLTWVNVENAAAYNGAMVKKAGSNVGTPLMPGRNFEIYVFGLFNENQKPGSIAEKNFGLFRPDFTEVYDIGIVNGTAPRRRSQAPAPAPSPTADSPSGGGGGAARAPTKPVSSSRGSADTPGESHGTVQKTSGTGNRVAGAGCAAFILVFTSLML